MPRRTAKRADDKRLKENRPPVPVKVERSRYQLLIDGDLKVEDLDDDEIMQGRCKNKNGGFSGRPPATFPRALHDAMRKEFQERINGKFNDGMQTALDTLTEVMTSRHAAAPARVRAAEVWLERTMGKVPDKVGMTVEIKKFEENIEGLLMDVGEDDNVFTITTATGTKETA